MAQIFQAKLYCNPYSLLVVNKAGKLVRVFCPFKVKAIVYNVYFKENTIHFVTLVKMGSPSDLIYVIDNKEFTSSLFIIIL